MHKIETNSEWMNANSKRKINCSHGCMCISREDKIGKWRSATGTTVSVGNVNDVKMFSWNAAHEWKKDAEKSATHIPMFPFHFVVKYARGAQPLVHLLPLPSSSACASLWQCFCTVFFSFRFCFICILLLNVSPLSLMVENLLVSLKKKRRQIKNALLCFCTLSLGCVLAIGSPNAPSIYPWEFCHLYICYANIANNNLNAASLFRSCRFIHYLLSRSVCLSWLAIFSVCLRLLSQSMIVFSILNNLFVQFLFGKNKPKSA